MTSVQSGVKEAVEQITSAANEFDWREGDTVVVHALDLRTLLAALSDANVEIVGLRADVEAAHVIGQSMLTKAYTDARAQFEVSAAMASALSDLCETRGTTDIAPGSGWHRARTALSQYHSLNGDA